MTDTPRFMYSTQYLESLMTSTSEEEPRAIFLTQCASHFASYAQSHDEKGPLSRRKISCSASDSTSHDDVSRELAGLV